MYVMFLSFLKKSKKKSRREYKFSGVIHHVASIVFFILSSKVSWNVPRDRKTRERGSAPLDFFLFHVYMYVTFRDERGAEARSRVFLSLEHSKKFFKKFLLEIWVKPVDLSLSRQEK